MNVQALLNEDLPRTSSSSTLPSTIDTSSRQLPYPPLRHRSESSHASSLSRSPTSSAIPTLERSNSSDSGVAQTPSPLTPVATAFDSHYRFPPTKLSHQQFYHYQRPEIKHARSYSHTYPPMEIPSESYQATPQSSAGPSDFSFPQVSQPPSSNPYYRPSLSHASSFNVQQQQQQPQQQQPLAQASVPPHTPHGPGQSQQNAMYQDSTVTASKSTKKNSYPCPVSKQYNCHEYFTTSGHAARHAKKHTGKKDAICPECGKAFTRKDNMEQHRRTHSGTRNTSATPSTSSKTISKIETPEEGRARRIRQQQRKARPSSISTASSSAAGPDLTMLDPALRGSPTNHMFPLVEDQASPYIYPGLQQQQLAPTAMMQQARPGIQRASHNHNLDHRLGPSPMMSSGPRYPSPPATSTSPSLAPALDALALAASRQGDGQ